MFEASERADVKGQEGSYAIIPFERGCVSYVDGNYY